jgi:hypothetical protein
LHFRNAFGHDAAKTRPTGGLPRTDAFPARLMQLRNRSKIQKGRWRMIRGHIERLSAISNEIEQMAEGLFRTARGTISRQGLREFAAPYGCAS